MRLLYATVLFEETDNLSEAEDVLAKGVSTRVLTSFTYANMKIGHARLQGKL